MATSISSNKLALKWGLIYLVTSIVLTYVFQFLNIDPNSPVKYISFIFFIVFLILTQKEYRDLLGGYLTYGEGFLSGLLYSVYSSVFGAIFIFIYLKFLSPQVFDQSIEASRSKMEDQGLSGEQIDKAMEFTHQYGVYLATVGTVIVMIILGVAAALITAAIMKKEKPLFLNEEPAEPTV